MIFLRSLKPSSESQTQLERANARLDEVLVNMTMQSEGIDRPRAELLVKKRVEKAVAKAVDGFKLTQRMI